MPGAPHHGSLLLLVASSPTAVGRFLRYYPDAEVPVGAFCRAQAATAATTGNTDAYLLLERDAAGWVVAGGGPRALFPEVPTVAFP